ncbi:hypothetical protein TgHK011_004754 [Trichoderma gracile]|nr:hypothetical protein TgHK011_004754 [Trichoderma gracile]
MKPSWPITSPATDPPTSGSSRPGSLHFNASSAVRRSSAFTILQLSSSVLIASWDMDVLPSSRLQGVGNTCDVDNVRTLRTQIDGRSDATLCG